MKFGPVVHQEMSSKEKNYGRTDDHNSSPRAFGSGELKQETTKSNPTCKELSQYLKKLCLLFFASEYILQYIP